MLFPILVYIGHNLKMRCAGAIGGVHPDEILAFSPHSPQDPEYVVSIPPERPEVFAVQKNQVAVINILLDLFKVPDSNPNLAELLPVYQQRKIEVVGNKIGPCKDVNFYTQWSASSPDQQLVLVRAAKECKVARHWKMEYPYQANERGQSGRERCECFSATDPKKAANT